MSSSNIGFNTHSTGYPHPDSGSGYPHPNSGPGYPPANSGPGYPPTSSGPGYPPPTSGSGYPPPTSGSGYPPSYVGSGGFQPQSGGPGYPPANSTPGYQPPTSGAGFPQPQPGGFAPPGYQPPPVVQQPSAGGYGPPGGHPPPFGSGAQPPPSYGQQPITSQPTANADGWMNIPQGIPNCPRGLEYLTSIDQLLIKQKIEFLEAITGFETNNKFTIKNSLGQKVYWAVETNDCLTRNCLGALRPFDMKIFDTFRNEILHLHRPLACAACCFPCCLQSMEVSAPPGNRIGRIQQEWSLCTPEFSVFDQSDRQVLRIVGPLCTFSMCGDVNFEILTMEGDPIGRISKQWGGLLREMFVDADYFGITFPMDLDVKLKAVMLGACFLIDAMYFEKVNNN